MRKSVATKRDFLTGEVIRLEKMKPYNDIQGIATVEMFSAETGEKLEETVSENFIADPMRDWQKELARMSFFSGKSDQTIFMNSYKDVLTRFNVQNLDPLTYMLLTDYGGPESPDIERLVRGNIIGYAARIGTYSGSDTQKGTINMSESFSEKNHMHFVFDFPTHAANGIIKSIYWNIAASYNDYMVNDYTWIELTDQLKPPNAGDPLRIKKIGDFWYISFIGKTSNGIIGKYKINFETKEITYLDYYKTRNTNYNLYDFTIFNDIVIYADGDFTGRIYLSNKDGSNALSAIIDLEGAAKYSTYISLDEPSEFYSKIKDFPGIEVIEGKLYVSSYLVKETSDSVWKFLVHKYDLSTGKLLDKNKIADLGSSSPSNYTVYISNNGDGLQIASNANGKLYSFLPDLSNVDQPIAFFCGSGETISGQYISEKLFAYVGVTNGKNYIKRLKPGAIGARNLLPAPITKTSANTMKITYDFYFEEPAW